MVWWPSAAVRGQAWLRCKRPRRSFAFIKKYFYTGDRDYVFSQSYEPNLQGLRNPKSRRVSRLEPPTARTRAVAPRPLDPTSPLSGVTWKIFTMIIMAPTRRAVLLMAAAATVVCVLPGTQAWRVVVPQDVSSRRSSQQRSSIVRARSRGASEVGRSAQYGRSM